jgi:hypothetical protein
MGESFHVVTVEWPGQLGRVGWPGATKKKPGQQRERH